MSSSGINSATTSAILLGIISQFWLRNYHPSWFRKYNYILGAALDAGSEMISFILSFVVFGESSVFGGSSPRPFPVVSSFHVSSKNKTLSANTFFLTVGWKPCQWK